VLVRSHSHDERPGGHSRCLVVSGGWPGHDPEGAARFTCDRLLDGFEVVHARDLDVLHPDVLAGFDLLLPIWTFGELTDEAERALATAVEAGLGVVAWHGHASAFLGSRLHKWLIGGQFVGHPGGSSVRYRVEFRDDHPLARGLGSVSIESEQYYLLVDPAVRIAATTRIVGETTDWLAGVEMPVAWTRSWGAGRVFYCALGHDVSVLERPPVPMLLRRAVGWARAGRAHAADLADRPASTALRARRTGTGPGG
jgi:hypothetical protein